MIILTNIYLNSSCPTYYICYQSDNLNTLEKNNLQNRYNRIWGRLKFDKKKKYENNQYILFTSYHISGCAQYLF